MILSRADFRLARVKRSAGVADDTLVTLRVAFKVELIQLFAGGRWVLAADARLAKAILQEKRFL